MTSSQTALSSLWSTFWSPWFWLPPNLTWDQLESKGAIRYPNFVNICLPIVLSFAISFIRSLVEKYVPFINFLFVLYLLCMKLLLWAGIYSFLLGSTMVSKIGRLQCQKMGCWRRLSTKAVLAASTKPRLSSRLHWHEDEKSYKQQPTTNSRW